MKRKHIRHCVTSFGLTAAMVLSLCSLNSTDVHASASSTEAPAQTVVSDLETPEGFQATFVLNQVVQDIVAGQTYDTDGTVYYTNAAGSYSSFTNRGDEPFTTALFIDETGLNTNKSVTEAISGGIYDSSSADGIYVESQADGFSGLLLTGANSDTTVSYSLSNSTLLMDSDNTDSTLSDFSGYGATIGAFANTKLTLDNVTVQTSGVQKSALIADQGADVYIHNSELYAAGGTLTDTYVNSAIQSMMCAPPWVLGIGGNARTINMLGDYPTLTVTDSEIGSANWATISTDACTQPTMAIIDSYLYQDGDTGYITYAIGDADEYFYGVDMDATTYANIITGGYVTYQSSTGTIPTYKYDSTGAKTIISETTGDGAVSTIDSDNFGIMFHGSGDANILDGTVLNTQNAAFLIRGVSNVDITVDDSEVNVADGTLIQLYDNDDSLVGATIADGGPVFNTTYSEEEGYPGIDYDYTTESDSSTDMPSDGPSDMPSDGPSDMPSGGSDTSSDTATFTNCDLDGNIYNGTGFFASGVTLDVTLGTGATLTGAISATSTMHSTDGGQTQNSSFTIDEYYLLSHVSNKPYYNEENDIHVTLEDGAVWTVDDTSIIASLNISDDSTVNGVAYTYEGFEDGSILLGEEVELASGSSYEDVLVLAADDTEIIEDEDGNLIINIDNSVTNIDNSTTNIDNSVTNNDNSVTNNITNNTSTTTTSSGSTTSTSTTSPSTGEHTPLTACILMALSGMIPLFAKKRLFLK